MCNIISNTIHAACIIITTSFFSVKQIANRSVFRVKISDILIPPQIAIFRISIFFETKKSPKLVIYIGTALV